MKYDITFKCEGGQYKLSECTKFITKRDILRTAEDLEGVGCGKLKQIVIDMKEY